MVCKLKLNIFYILLSYSTMNLSTSLNVDNIVNDANIQEDLPPSYEISMGLISKSFVITTNPLTLFTLNENEITDQAKPENTTSVAKNCLLLSKPYFKYFLKVIVIVFLLGLLYLGIYILLNLSVTAGIVLSVVAISALYFLFDMFYLSKQR